MICHFADDVFASRAKSARERHRVWTKENTRPDRDATVVHTGGQLGRMLLVFRQAGIFSWKVPLALQRACKQYVETAVVKIRRVLRKCFSQISQKSLTKQSRVWAAKSHATFIDVGQLGWRKPIHDRSLHH